MHREKPGKLPGPKAGIDLWLLVRLPITVWTLFCCLPVFIINFFYSAFKDRRVTSPDPWQAATPEWTAMIHPQHGNRPGDIPEVHRWPHDYNKECRACIPQTESPELSRKVVKNPA